MLIRCAASGHAQSKMNSPSLLPFRYEGATATSVSSRHSDRCAGTQPVSLPTHPVASSASSQVCSTNGEPSSPTMASQVSRGTSRTLSRTRSVWTSERLKTRISRGGRRVLPDEHEPGVHPSVLLAGPADGHVSRDAAHHVDHPVVDEAPQLHRVGHNLGPSRHLLGGEHRVVDVNLARVGGGVSDVVAGPGQPREALEVEADEAVLRLRVGG